jgi:sugar/nucleoside kinase (ribokinase family)
VVVDRAAVSTGGGAANVGLSARRLGLSVAMMGKCGDDVLGRTLLEVLRGFSADCAAGMRIAAGESTSYTVVLAPPGTDRIFLHCPGANDTFVADDVDLDLVARGRLFYFGYPPLMARMYAGKGEELAELLRRVKDKGVTVALDMALPDPAGPTGQAPWPEILAGALPHVDLFAPSVEELTLMLSRTDYDRMVADGDILDQLTPALLRALSGRCLDMGVAVVMIKCGRHGLYVRSAGGERIAQMGSAAPDADGWADGEMFRPSYRVDAVVSATGAGDSAVAGFLAGLLRGADLPAAADYACAAGAHNVSALDTTSGLRSWEETTAALTDPRVPPIIALD